jgi:hypothetical protein
MHGSAGGRPPGGWHGGPAMCQTQDLLPRPTVPLRLHRRELLSSGLVAPIGARALEIIEVLVRSFRTSRRLPCRFTE